MSSNVLVLTQTCTTVVQAAGPVKRAWRRLNTRDTSGASHCKFVAHGRGRFLASADTTRPRQGGEAFRGVADLREQIDMHLLPRALKRAGAHPFERRESAPTTGPRPGDCPSPHTWAAILAEARHRRSPPMWPPPRQHLREEPVIDSALVRAYVLPADERTRTLATPTRETR